VRWGLDLCRFPAKLANYSDMSAEVHVQAQISPFFCSQVVFRFNLSREAKIKEGKILAPKDLVRCLLGKNVHFLEARCLDSI
jgi:hypothetical protein